MNNPLVTPVMTPSPGAAALDALRDLFEARGALRYGERVNQIEHALQCAALAEAEGAEAYLVVAALLHDVGHMLHRDAAGALAAGRNDGHEALASKWLARWFGPDVTEPIAMHVDAKRYLCRREAGYLEALSPVSVRSLEIQGGPMTDVEAEAFERRPHLTGAVRVRRWDDQGKNEAMATPPLAHYLQIAAGCIRTA